MITIPHHKICEGVKSHHKRQQKIPTFVIVDKDVLMSREMLIIVLVADSYGEGACACHGIRAVLPSHVPHDNWQEVLLLFFTEKLLIGPHDCRSFTIVSI